MDMAEIEGEEQAAAQQEGEDRVLPVAKTEDPCVVETSLEEVPETLVDEHEQELPAHEESEEDDELISLVQQLEEVEEAAGNATLMSSRGEGDRSERVAEVAQHLSFQLFSTEARAEAVRREPAGGGEAAEVAGEEGRAADGAARPSLSPPGGSTSTAHEENGENRDSDRAFSYGADADTAGTVQLDQMQKQIMDSARRYCISTLNKGATGLPLRVSAVVGHRGGKREERERKQHFFLVRRAKGSLAALLLTPYYCIASLTDMHSFADAFCARSSAKYQVQLRTIPQGHAVT